MDKHLTGSAASAAALLLLLCGMTATSGISQQQFEWVAPPESYASGLVASATWLRALIAVDDLFIAAYALTTVLLVTRLATGRLRPLHWFALGLGIAAALLDFAENHHLLAMLRWAESGCAVPPEQILERSTASQLKWMLGHTAFVAVGLLLPAGNDAMRRLFRASLLFVQLPLGAATWVVDAPPWAGVLVWARYATFLSGFGLIAWFARVGLSAGAKDAPA